MNTNFCTESATTLTASSSDASFPLSNLKNPLRSKRWRSTGVTTENIVFDMVTTEDIDSVVLLWSKEDGIRLSNTAVIKIQANATNVWTSPAVDQTLTINNTYSVASHYFTSDKSYRYWRILITDPGNPWGYIELGMAWLGKGIDIDNAQNGFQYNITDQSKAMSNDFGHKYIDEYPQVAKLDLGYNFLDYTVVQTLENAYRVNGNRKPVLVALDPVAAVFNKDHFMIYGMMSNKLGLNHVIYNLLGTDGISIEELS